VGSYPPSRGDGAFTVSRAPANVGLPAARMSDGAVQRTGGYDPSRAFGAELLTSATNPKRTLVADIVVV
jgi:hypothetical protein